MYPQVSEKLIPLVHCTLNLVLYITVGNGFGNRSSFTIVIIFEKFTLWSIRIVPKKQTHFFYLLSGNGCNFCGKVSWIFKRGRFLKFHGIVVLSSERKFSELKICLGTWVHDLLSRCSLVFWGKFNKLLTKARWASENFLNRLENCLRGSYLNFQWMPPVFLRRRLMNYWKDSWPYKKGFV